MNHKSIIRFIILFILFGTLYSNTQKTTNNNYSEDVTEVLALSKRDSLNLHIGEIIDGWEVYECDYNKLTDISESGRKFHIRSMLTIFKSIDGNQRYGSARILTKEASSSSEIQKISLDSIEVFVGSLSGFNPMTEIYDVNYDGYKDIHISFIENTTGRSFNNYFYLFDSDKNEFVSDSLMNTTFGEMHIGVEVYNKVISTGGRFGLTGFMGDEYTWDGNYYKLTTRYYIENSIPQIERVSKLIDGEWVVVKTDTLD